MRRVSALVPRAGGGLLVIAVATSACSLLLNDDDYSGTPDLTPRAEGGVDAPSLLDGQAPDGDGAADADADAPNDPPDSGKHGRAFVAVGENGRRAVSTDDGLTWRLVAESDASASKLNSVTFGLGRFVAVGTVFTPAFRTSVTDDFANWAWIDTEVSNAGGPEQVVFGADRFVAVGAYRSSTVSTDGNAWFTYQVEFDFNGLTFGAGKFVGVGSQGNKGAVASSTDGITWTPISIGGSELMAIAYGNGRFVAVGNNGRTGTSPDGVSWTFNPEIGTQRFHSIAYGQGLFVTNDGRTSSDGLLWTAPVFGDGPVIYGGGVFVHFNIPNQSFYRSTNGTSWGQPVQMIPGIAALGYGEW